MELLILVLLLQLLVLRFRNSSETEKVENFFADKFPIFRVQELELRLVEAWNRHKSFLYQCLVAIDGFSSGLAAFASIAKSLA